MDRQAIHNALLQSEYRRYATVEAGGTIDPCIRCASTNITVEGPLFSCERLYLAGGSHYEVTCLDCMTSSPAANWNWTREETEPRND